MTDTHDDDERRSRLIGVKLRALVGEHLGRPVAEAGEFAPGAALRDGDDAWVYLDRRPAERLGASLAWAIRSGASALHLIAEEGVGTLARRADEFDLPISVWRAEERSLLPVEPDDLPPSAPAPDHHEALRPLIVEGGAEPIVEHGVLTGEVRGLEVCRVVDDATTDATRLEVGVGDHDREAFQMLHGDVPTVESLARVVDSVARHRTSDAPPHPLKSLGAERLIRWQIEQQPSLVGATLIAPAPPPLPRPNLKDPVPCVAVGIGANGEQIVVVCSSGVDLDLIPYAADARLAVRGPGAGGGHLVVALPSRDRIGLVDEIADRLRHSVSFVSVD
ncbi:hypothetical protein [Ilumatobacter sp.]|uniref:hypothetical protein n=1 Tax=Ilumatobacter sp. TaxID=1967498 RepID=UPI003AF6F1DA